MNDQRKAEIDLEAMLADLGKSRAIQNETNRRDEVEHLKVAALIDIAGSLRIVAAEAALAMAGEYGALDTGDEPDTEADTGAGDFFVVGDRVGIEADNVTGEIVRFGTSEGEQWADVAIDVNGVGVGIETRRYFTQYMTRLSDTHAANVSGAESDDELDEFTAPATGLDALRGETKATKKKGKKS